MDKETAIQDLKHRIEEEHSNLRPPRKVWFWLSGSEMSARGWNTREQVAAVRGFMGTASCIFTGFMPSTREGRLTEDYDPDEFLYGCLAEHGLADVHLTDVFKLGLGKRTCLWLRTTPRC